jgi:hypothetical protein
MVIAIVIGTIQEKIDPVGFKKEWVAELLESLEQAQM